MDIERLNKIKQICFAKDKKKGSATFGSVRQRRRSGSRSPYQGDAVRFTQEKGKENSTSQVVSNTYNQNPIRSRQRTDHLKKIEKEVTELYEKKQQKLEQNIQKFNENLKMKRKLKETMALSLQNQLTQNYQTTSPERNGRSAINQIFQSPNDYLRNPELYDNLISLSQVKKSYSPMISIQQPYLGAENWNFQQSVTKRSNSFCDTSQFGFNNNHNQFGFFGQESSFIHQEVDGDCESRPQRVKKLLNKLLNQASYPRNSPVLPQKAIEEMKLKLNGAFDKLIKLPSANNDSHINQIIEACLKDLETKLKIVTPRNDPISLRNFLQVVTEQVAIVDLQDFLPKLLDFINNLKFSHGLYIIEKRLQFQNIFKLRKAFNCFSSLASQKRKVGDQIMMVLEKRLCKAHYSSLSSSFQQWKFQSKDKKRALESHVLKLYSQYFSEAIKDVKSMTNYFTSTSNFIKTCLDQSKGTYIDLIYLQGSQFITYDDNETEIVIDLEQVSLLKQIQTYKQNPTSKQQYLSGVTQRKNFNQTVDIPFIAQQTQFIKDTKQLHQIYYPIFNHNKSLNKEKRLYFVLRLSFHNVPDLETQKQHSITQTLKKVSPLIIQSFKLFRNLHLQYKKFDERLENACQNQSSLGNDKVMNRLQYIQTKSLELNYIITVGDCFKFVNTVVREMFNYEKCTIIQYNQGTLYKLYDKSKTHDNSSSHTQSSQNHSEIGKIEEKRSTHVINSMIQQQIVDDPLSQGTEQSLNESNTVKRLIRQEMEQVEDSFEMEGKINKDVVVVALDFIKQNSSLMELNSLYLSNSGVQSNISQIGDKYFLRMEKKIDKQKDQEDFAAKNDSFTVLRAFIQLMMISINKMKIIQQQKEFYAAQRLIDTQNLKSNNHNDLEVSKISQINEDLQYLLQVQTQIDNFIENLKQSEGIICFEELQSKLYEFLQEHVENFRNLQLFLSKDSNGHLIYTYIYDRNNELIIPQSQAEQINTNNLASLQCTSRFQSTIPYNRQCSSLATQNIISSPKKLMLQQKGHVVRPNSQINPGFNQQFNQILPSQLDDISSISANEHTHIIGNCADKISMAGMNTFLDNNCNQDHASQKHLSLTRQPSMNLQGSSSSRNLDKHLNFINRKQSLLRDSSGAQSELVLQIQPSKVKNQNNNNSNQQTYCLKAHNLQSDDQDNHSDHLNNQGTQIHHVQTFSQQPKLQQQQLNPSQPVLSSFDEIYLSQFNEETDEFDILSQDQSAKKIEVKTKQVKSLISYAITNTKEVSGLMKRNVKKEKRYNSRYDNLINFEGEAKGVIENAIFMPMINKKEQVIGLIQIGNNDKSLPFNDRDLQILRYLGQKIANYISEIKEQQCNKLLFKKQMEISVLHSTLENQSITKILTLANQLFQAKNVKPMIAVGVFAKKTEKYLRQTFNCQASQILLVDHQIQGIFSFSVKDKSAKLIRRADFTDESISNLLIRNQLQDPIVWPTTNEKYIFIGDESEMSPHSQKPKSQHYLYTQLLNMSIDCPSKVQDSPSTYLMVAVRDLQDQNKVIGIIQLMQRANGFRFVEQDVKHLSLLSEHLSQVLSYIFNENYLQAFSQEQLSKLDHMLKIFTKKQRHHYKCLFRELLEYKFGKINLLKNKILRKYIDRHLQVDKALVSKVRRLAEIKEKINHSRKQETLKEFKYKLALINKHRQKNAQKCMLIINKYEKLLGLRVKDTVFRFWDNLKQGDQSVQRNIQVMGVNTSSFENSYCDNLHERNDNNKGMNHFSSTFNLKDQSALSISQISNYSILDESSVTSVLYLKAKALYKLKRIFNQKKVKFYFEAYVLKSFNQDHRHYVLTFEIKRIFALRNIVAKEIKKQNQLVLKVFQGHAHRTQSKSKSLQRLISRKYLHSMSFGIKRWQQQAESEIKRELRIERSFTSQLTEQCKDGFILQILMRGLNDLAQQQFNSVDDCLHSETLKQTLAQLCDFLANQSSTTTHFVLTFKLPDNYHRQDLFAMFSYQDINVKGQQRILTQSEEDERLSSSPHFNIEVSSNSKAQYFSSISEIPKGSQTVNFSKHQDQKYFLTLIDSQQDLILKSASIQKSPLTFIRLQEDHQIQQLALKPRQISHNQTQAYIIPLLSQNNANPKGSLNQSLFGTLELYQSGQSYYAFDQNQLISSEDQTKLRQYASILQMGLQSLVQKLYFIQSIYQIQLKQELATLSQPKLTNNNSLSSIVQQLSLKIQDSLRVDHCLLIFVPQPLQNSGVFYNFQNNKLYSIDFTNNFFAGLLSESASRIPQYRQVTFPSSLLCSREMNFSEGTQFSPFKRLQEASPNGVGKIEKYETMTGEAYQALKYFPVTKSDKLVLYVELGWRFMSEAQQFHENDHYMQKKEEQINDLILRKIEKVTRNIKYLIFIMEGKLSKLDNKKTLVEKFKIWKSLSYLRLAKSGGRDSKLQGQNANMQQSKFSPLRERGREMHEQFMSEKPTEYQRRCSPLNSQSMISANHSANKYKRENSQGPTHSRRISHLSNPINEDDFSEIEVEKAAKRKLVSAALLLISISQKTIKSQKKRLAFQTWKSYSLSTQIAENAFNKLLEINHAHSKVRFSTAARLLEKLFKNHTSKVFIFALKANSTMSASKNLESGVAKRTHHNRILSQPQGLPSSSSNTHIQPLNQHHYHNLNHGVHPSHNHHQHHLPIASSTKQSFKLDFSGLRGIDTQNFEDDVFSLKELNDSKIYKLGVSHMGNAKLQSQQYQMHYNNGQQLLNMETGSIDNDSEFSLGTGTKNMIKFKAENILELARNEFKTQSQFKR